jgi:hypothetical protein
MLEMFLHVCSPLREGKIKEIIWEGSEQFAVGGLQLI